MSHILIACDVYLLSMLFCLVYVGEHSNFKKFPTHTQDHGVMPVAIEIMTVLWRWISKAQDNHGHIMSHILIAYDVYLLYILFCLVRR